MEIIARRKTAESEVEVALNLGPRLDDPKKGLSTTLPFLNHMLEHIMWRGEFNLRVEVKLSGFYLSHVVCEDIGLTVGRALKKTVEDGLEKGVKGYGFAYATIDEALARAVLSFENRALLDFSCAPGVEVPAHTENMNSEDLQAFLEGLVQGASCTLHLDLLKGVNGHHLWEASFRALGEALRQVLNRREWRKGITSGVAGPIELQVEKSNEADERGKSGE